MALINRVKELYDAGEWDGNLEAWDTAFINEGQKLRNNNGLIISFDLKIK
tara:strand:+ start:97 stop:246 length:150 start_codon:yes stop_codon:yes gene_type:complete